MNMGWMPEYVEDNLTVTLESALRRNWNKTLPLPVAASMLCQYFKIWTPTVKASNRSYAGEMMPGVQRV